MELALKPCGLVAIKIRRAGTKDFRSLYRFGLAINELKVSDKEPFMTPQEFKWHMGNPHGIFLVAEEEGKLVGFVYANMRDSDRSEPGTACLVYLAVDGKRRRQGIGRKLYSTVESKLKQRGVNYVYALASANDAPVIGFNESQGLKKGRNFVWMSKRLR